MAKLLIQTQVYENYAWREDGTLGTGDDAYWKAKGGSDYVVRNIDINCVQEIADRACAEVEQNNDAYQESVISWQVVEDDYLTEFEQSQLEYEGRIRYPAHELAV
jgi:hypothetical protein